MPLNESSRPQPSNLTRDQKQEALAACYGLPAPIDALEQEKFHRLLSNEEAEPNE
jgi:hypothetical protein